MKSWGLSQMRRPVNRRKKLIWRRKAEAFYHYLKETGFWTDIGCVLMLLLFGKRVMLDGFGTYRRLLQRKTAADRTDGNPEAKLYFMDYEGSGDTYLCCSWLLEHGLISEKDTFIAPSRVSQKVASYFPFGTVEEIPKRKAHAIRVMGRFYGGRLEILPLLYESVPLVYSGVLRHMQGHRGLDFPSMLRIGFEIHLGWKDDGKNWRFYSLPYEQRELERFMSRYGLRPGKVALLAPYDGNFTEEIPLRFYLEAAARLKAQGYTVCTNSADPRREPPVPGTTPICPPYHLVGPMLFGGGVFIGQRSGLCDIIAGTQGCRKIILYYGGRTPEGVGTWREFFSLERIGLCEREVEIE